jgi:hypothetical protein
MNFKDFEENDMAREDKILNNSFNTGDINYENFSQPMKVDARVSHLYKDQLSENIIEERTLKLLDERIYEYFVDSPFYEKYKNPKRVDKIDLIKMYYYFKDLLIAEKSFSIVQIFMGFAEFFQINYDQLYTEIGVLDKESLLKELNDKFSLNKKIKTKKLF